MRGKKWVAALVVAALCGAGATAASANELVTIAIPARHGEVADKWLPGYPGPPRARVLLPDGYDPSRAYPLLVLLNGLVSSYASWSNPGEGEIATTARGLDAIVVMPEGASGWYTDWWNHGQRGNPAWESYLLDEVMPQIRERYRILPDRRYHALGGNSMGGLGAAYLGGRLPGYFGTVVVLSGLVDLQLFPLTGAVMSLISEGASGGSLDLEAVQGPAGGFYANGHNPPRLASNLAQTRMFMAAGDGTPCTDSERSLNAITDAAAEGAIIRPTSNSYAAALQQARVGFVYMKHCGYHDWPNFHRELRDAIAWGLFKPVAEHATEWVNDTVATHGQLWEFAYRFDSPPTQVVRFRRSAGVLSVGAAGSPVTITTDGGCVIHVATPADVEVPPRPCATLALRLRPRSLSVGRWTRVRATVSPPAPGTVVTLGSARAVTDDLGVAWLRVCLRSPGPRRVHATVANRLPATAVVRGRGAAGSCPG
jgi:S-formylglutathione hydrolase FrmB